MGNTIGENQFILIVGAMKCGTSSLFRHLENHPQICPAFNKEPEFFSENQGHRVQLDSYEDLWPTFDPQMHRYAMEASTGYTKFPVEKNLPERISKAGLRPKFIYIVRDPFERIVSHYNFMRQQFPHELDLVNSSYANISDYFLQLEQYQPFFPRENFLILDFDELKSSPLTLLDKIYGFLGLEKKVYPESFAVVNALQMESTPETLLRTSRIQPLLHMMPMPIKNFGKAILRKLRPPRKRLLSESEKDYLREKLAPGMKLFQEQYGFNVQKWGFGD